ncbi:hypothetical protein NL676_039483 [Syzygium grande]|nr:hypothetical protein NL676_039483 [Syzygium grande]
MPVLNIMDSDMLKEIFSRVNDFEKPHPKAIADTLTSELLNIEGEKWAKHRKIINPAFHYEKLKPLLPTKLHKRMKEIDRKVKGLLEDVVTKREKAMKEGEVDDDDLLGLLLNSNMKEIQESGHQKGMSIVDVIQECKAFNRAAQAASILLTWTLILLSKYQSWQDRAREEILRVFSNKKT